MVFGFGATNLIIYGIPFWTKQPTYKCVLTSANFDLDEVCTAENICINDSRIESWEVDYTNPESIHNWYEQLDLMCETSSLIGTFGSAFFFGWCLTLLWVPRLSDIYGR